MGNSIDIQAGRQAMATMRAIDEKRSLHGHLSSLVTEPAGICLTSGKWFVISAEPRQEELASKGLSSIGFPTYRPRTRKRERHGRSKMRWVERSMFGAYMFVKCDPINEHWNQVAVTRGVKKLIDLGQGAPRSVPDAAIEVIRYVESLDANAADEEVELDVAKEVAKAGGRSGIVWYFSPGDVARIKEGAFAGFCVQLETAVDVHDRIRVTLNLLGGPVSTEISAHDLEAI